MTWTSGVTLTEQKWNTIRKLGGLPENARPDMEYLLSWYRVFASNTEEIDQPDVIRERLDRVKRAADKLQSELAKITGYDLVVALLPPDDPVRQTQLADLTERFASAPDEKKVALAISLGRAGADLPNMGTLKLLDQKKDEVAAISAWFASASDRLLRGKSGPHKQKEDMRWFIGKLDELLYRHTKQRLHATDDGPDIHFAEACARIVHPTGVRSSVEKAIADLRRT